VDSVFQQDLKTGKAIEEKVLTIIKKKYPLAVLIDGKFKDYDIFIPENNKTVEVKVDLLTGKTGNMRIELYMDGKPSALLATKADYWVFYTGNGFAWTTPKKLIECIMLNNIPSQKITGRGDTTAKVACLVPNHIFKKYVIQNIS